MEQTGIQQSAEQAEKEKGMKSTPIKICKHCGKEILILSERMYRSIVVDADAVEVAADPLGDEYVRLDGTKVKARALKIDEIVTWAEYAYRPHRWSCGMDV